MKRTCLLIVLSSISTLYMIAQPSFPRDRHRIGIRSNGSEQEFFDKMTGEKFTPNGFNLIQLIQSPHDWYGISELFQPTLHDREAVEQDLQQMSALGYNSLRVFIDLCKDTFCIGDVDGGLESGYMDNLAWFLERAREYELFVMLTANWIPDVGGYVDGVYEACGDQFDLGNCLLLSEKGVSGYQRYFRDLIRELRERDAPFDIIFAYQLRNEAYFELNEPPFNLSSGMVATANGKTYNMSSETEKLEMADEGMVYWADQVRDAILDVDTSALVTCGFFAPNSPNQIRGDEPIKLVPFKAIFDHSEIDFLDIHAYPGDYPLAIHMENYGLLAAVDIPIVLGEYGAFRTVSSDPYDGAIKLDAWQSEICDYGIDGYYVWTWDHDRTPHQEPDEIWGGSEANSVIAKVLSPLYKPYPCIPLRAPLNLSLGKSTNASMAWETFTSDQVVDGNNTDTPWISGGNPPQWVEVDLGEPSEVGEIQVIVETGNVDPQQYKHELYVKGPITGGAFELVETWSGLRDDLELLLYDVPDSLRKGLQWVRVLITEAPGWAALHEINVLRPRDDSLLMNPSPPVLVNPLPGNELINTGTLQLSWKNSSTSDSSWLQLSNKQSFQSLLMDIMQKDSAFHLTNIILDSIHYWRVRQKNENGWGPWSVTGKFIRKDATAVESTAFDHLVKVYPNPFKQELVLESGISNQILKVEVYNMLGERVVVSSENRNDTRTSMHIKFTGLLVLKIEFEDGTKVMRKVISY